MPQWLFRLIFLPFVFMEYQANRRIAAFHNFHKSHDRIHPKFWSDDWKHLDRRP